MAKVSIKASENGPLIVDVDGNSLLDYQRKINVKVMRLKK